MAEKESGNRKKTFGDALIRAIDKRGPEEATLQEVTELLAAGADVNATDKHKRTALMRAAKDGYVAVAKALIEAGANVNAIRRSCGYSALIEAIESSHVSMVELLLKHGADVEVTTDSGTTALHRAVWNCDAQMNSGMAIVKLLLEAKAQVNRPDGLGKTALAMAYKVSRNSKLVFLLADFGASETPEPDRPPVSAKWGPDTPQPDLSVAAKSPQFLQAVKHVEQASGGTALPHSVNGVYAIHPKQKVVLEALQDAIAPLKSFVFSNAIDEEMLLMIPSADPYVAVAVMQTNGQNYEIGPGGVIEWLKKLNRTQPFKLSIIGVDQVGGRFTTPIKKPKALAARIEEFCPDVVSQGCGSVEALAEALKSKQSFYLWWD